MGPINHSPFSHPTSGEWREEADGDHNSIFVHMNGSLEDEAGVSALLCFRALRARIAGRQCCGGAGPLPGVRGTLTALQAAHSLRGKKTLGCTCHSYSTPGKASQRGVKRGQECYTTPSTWRKHEEKERQPPSCAPSLWRHHLLSAPQAPLHPPKAL